MKNLITLLLFVLFTGSLPAQVSMDEFYPIDRGHSYVGFEVKYMGYAKVKGRFEKFKGIVRYDEKNLKSTSVSFSVDATSIDTDHDWRDKDLKSANWFGVEEYPAMTFTSKSVKPLKKGFEVIGDMTVKDVTKEVSFIMDPPSGVLKDGRGDKQVIFTGRADIDRTDFHIEGENWSKVKEGIAAVSNKVSIEVTILGKQYQENNLSGFVRNPKRPPGALHAAYEEGGVAATLKQLEAMQADEAVKLNENALNIVAFLLIRKGKLDDALALMEANVAAFPESSEAQANLAEVYARNGKIKQAKKYFEKSLELDPNNLTAAEMMRHLK